MNKMDEYDEVLRERQFNRGYEDAWTGREKDTYTGGAYNTGWERAMLDLKEAQNG